MISLLILITDFITAHQTHIIYRSGPIPGDFDKLAQFSIVAGILVTTNYIFGILIWCIPALLGLIPAGAGDLFIRLVWSIKCFRVKKKRSS
jgi:hypothetical protein